MATRQQHDSDQSPALIIRYLRSDSNKNKVAKKVNGEREAVKWLEKLKKEETEPKKYGYLWRWENPQDALAYELEMLDKKSEPNG
ncbi:MAG: hypothetical protein H0U45_14475 [Tatlockia sp.]|jgi:hypothetical protein|nr:hypothetical protein [Tatlockia sp.]